MGATNAKWRGGQLAFYDGTTYETALPLAPRYLYDDFEGDTYNSNIWLYNDAGNATQNVVAGDVVLLFTNTNQNQEAGIEASVGSLDWDASKGLIIEFRINLAVLPNAAEVEGHWGILGEILVDDKQIVTAEDYKEYCVFSVVANGTVTVNCDDNVAGSQHAVATGVTVVAGAYHVYRIDITDITNILFYIDGVQVAPTTTFTLDSLVSDLVQPVAFLTKHDGTGVGTMNVDYIKIWQAMR
jgi:hypothetical protein